MFVIPPQTHWFLFIVLSWNFKENKMYSDIVFTFFLISSSSKNFDMDDCQWQSK